jgi:hypothetical protein
MEDGGDGPEHPTPSLPRVPASKHLVSR